MAHKLSKGSTKNGRDSVAKRLGVKLFGGQQAQKGSIIVRQRGTKFLAGDNVSVANDHTLFATADGLVEFSDVRKKRFDGRIYSHKLVSIKAHQ